jgi:hypothetical protein
MNSGNLIANVDAAVPSTLPSTRTYLEGCAASFRNANPVLAHWQAGEVAYGGHGRRAHEGPYR